MPGHHDRRARDDAGAIADFDHLGDAFVPDRERGLERRNTGDDRAIEVTRRRSDGTHDHLVVGLDPRLGDLAELESHWSNEFQAAHQRDALTAPAGRTISSREEARSRLGLPIAIFASAQFVMVLERSIMNVGISPKDAKEA